MKNLILTTLFISAGILLTAEKKGKLSDDSVVTYSNNESGKLEGLYMINDKSNKLILRGAYTDGQPTKEWYAFDSTGTVLLRYNYAIKKLISISDKQTDGLEINILDKEEEVVKNAKIPLLIYSLSNFKTLMVNELLLQMPPKQKANKANVKGLVTAYIKEDGNTKYEVKYAIDGYEYKTSVDLDKKFFKVVWIPASYKDKNYKSEVKFNIDFRIDPSNQRRFIWNY